MSPEKNLRQAIIDSAAKLFMEQGYSATSIKQIAKAAGCKTSSMYYYFEDGKSEILGEVIRSTQLNIPAMFDDREYDSLTDFFSHYIDIAKTHMPSFSQRLSWLIPEYNQLSEQEIAYIQNQLIQMHDEIEKRIIPLVKSDHETDSIAWMITCAFFGYGNIFINMRMRNRIDFDFDDFGRGFIGFTGGQ